MAAAIVPLIEIGVQELPTLAHLGMEIINGLKLIFHKPTDQRFAPDQVAQMQAMSLAGFKAKLQLAFPDMAKTVTDTQIANFVELLYQTQKIVTADPVLAPVAPAITSGVSSIVQLIQLAMGAFAEFQALKAQIPATAK